MFTGVLSPFPPLVSPRLFFLPEFFSRALLSERLEQATSVANLDQEPDHQRLVSLARRLVSVIA